MRASLNRISPNRGSTARTLRVLACAVSLGALIAGFCAPATAGTPEGAPIPPATPAPAAPATAAPATPAPATPAPATERPAPEPSEPGPYTVHTRTYRLGETAFQPTNFPGRVELEGVVHAPEHAKGRRMPLVVLLHGRHEACGRADGDTAFEGWPCKAPYRSIPSYRGYDYVGKNLASHGYVVVSISANGINALDAEDDGFGQTARGELIQKHLDLWRTWTRGDGGGPFGATYRGAIDFQRIGTMGHSRGGEGVVHQLAVNEKAGRPYGMRAVLPLAPTDFFRWVPKGVPSATVLPTCDGDVYDLQGARYYDDARYAQERDRAPKHLATITGANHNFFNTVWSPSSGQPGAADDWQWMEEAGAESVECAKDATNRLSEKEQRAAGAAYLSSFFRLELGHEHRFAGLWDGSRSAPPSVGSAEVAMTYLAPDRRWLRGDINRLTESDHLTRNEFGGRVGLGGFDQPALCGGRGSAPTFCLSGEYAGRLDLEPHGPSPDFEAQGILPGTNLLRLRWDQPGATFGNELPEQARLAARYPTLRFRAAVDFSDARNPTEAKLPITVVLTDGAGRRAALDASRYGTALDYPDLLAKMPDPETGEVDELRRLLLSQVRMPLRDFDGINLADVRSVTLRPAGGPGNGAAVVGDLAFSR